MCIRDSLILTLFVGVRDFTRLIALEEKHLRDALVGINLRGQWRRVADLDRDITVPGLSLIHI